MSVNVWGVITKGGLGPSCRISGRLGADSGIDIIYEQLVQHVLDGPFPDGFFHLQHDLDPVHTARAVKTYHEELGMMALAEPPQGQI